MSEKESQILAMYDVRGIQNYIFRTTKLKDAIGASYIVETIIQDALSEASQTAKNNNEKFKEITIDLQWENEDSIIKYNGEDSDVQVLYIGGGNAYVLYSSDELCHYVNRIMSKYVLEHTYSLQLAIATYKKTGDYADDYRKLNEEMNRIKADMIDSRPIGTLPVMAMEYQTGLPVFGKDENDIWMSKETELKREAEDIIRPKKNHDSERRRFDSYIEKGVDSTLSVIHIDGNNMGLRIRELIKDEKDYISAVNSMRHISHNINWSYKNVFEQMQKRFNTYINPKTKKNDYYVLKVLVAGDDLTYVCNGAIAIATVQYFVREITKHCMNENMEGEDLNKYGFSVCAGIAYIRSHFPFSIGYEVAESCCASAKERAKEKAENGKIGNFFDFQFCKNIQAKDIKDIRRSEYHTASGENLMIRPYGFESGDYYDFEHLRKAIQGFESSDDNDFKHLREEIQGSNNKIIPRTVSKKLRNIYPLGKNEVNQFVTFLNSRNRKLPAMNEEEISLSHMYIEDGEKVYARYYDALELMDDYIDLEVIEIRRQQNDYSEV